MEQIIAMLNYLISKYTFVVDQKEFNEREQIKNDIIKGIEKLEKKNQELIRAIGILKSYLWVSSEIDFDTYSTSRLTQQEYDLLKEVLW